MNEWNFVIGAYGLTWTALVAYAVYLHVRLVRANRALGEEAERPEDR